MLRQLIIQNFVVIDRLTLEFAEGLTVLTGETGAGKSILLDAMDMVLGGRATRQLIRSGAEKSQITAVFEISPDHPVYPFIESLGLETDAADQIVLRRQLEDNGKSRGWVNDQPVSQQALRQIGEYVLEIHGQFASRDLLDPTYHRDMVDQFGQYQDSVERCRRSWQLWQEAQKRQKELSDHMAEAQKEAENISYALQELEQLQPLAQECRQLEQKRQIVQHYEKMAEALNQMSILLQERDGAQDQLAQALRHGEVLRNIMAEATEPAVAALERALAEIEDALHYIQDLQADLDTPEQNLESLDDRLFALREAGRKYHYDPNRLPELYAELQHKQNLSQDQTQLLQKAEDDVKKTAGLYEESSAELTRQRQNAAKAITEKVTEELHPLHLGQAQFTVACQILPDQQWGAKGKDHLCFLVAPNPGLPPGPLHKIASGGELARFLLALLVVLGERQDRAHPFVFDEIDSGTSGAVADAVGERLAKLAQNRQVFTITHSPQIAARAHHHLLVRKGQDDKGITTTHITPLTPEARREEIARLISGATISDAARAAATSLLNQQAIAPGKTQDPLKNPKASEKTERNKNVP